MNASLLHPKNVIVQGITGTHGRFHTGHMQTAGTNIVAGTSPGKAGQSVDGIPVYNTVADIQNEFSINASVIFVPAAHAKAALLEAISAKIPLVVCITEGIPVHDMLYVKRRAALAGVVLVGPNCPGILLPGTLKLGIIPETMGLLGHIGVVSRSGTLTYEVAAGLSARGVGQKYIIGIGGDPVCGTDFIDFLELFEHDDDVKSIVLVGEIGGSSEQMAAKYIRTSISKTVYSYIAGHTAPPGVQLGHAGAILRNNTDSAAAKTAILKKAGVHTFQSISELISAVKVI